MEGYFERVVDVLTGAGYRWYETANFCRARSARRRGTSARATTSATGAAATTSGSASAPSRQSVGVRWRNAPSLGSLHRGARAMASAPPRELEPLDAGRARASG